MGEDFLKDILEEGEVIKAVKEVVSLPSYFGLREQEKKVAEYFHNLFISEGIESELIHVRDERYNIVARLRGSGGKTLLLTGHLDTVPPYGMERPFDVVEEDGRLKGRGVVDMKGALVSMAYALIGIKRAGLKHKGDIIFAGVIDEEEKSLGTIDLIESGIKADAAIVGEPSELNICLAHRGLEWLEFNFKGKTVHGGRQDEGINAIVKAADFIERVNREIVPKLEGQLHKLIGSSSLNFGTIRGGSQPSTVPGQALVQLDVRWIPGLEYESILSLFTDLIEKMEVEDEDFHCSMKVMDNSLMDKGYIHQPMEIDEGHEIIKLTEKITEEVFGKKPKLTYFPAWSDGGLLSSHGIATIVYGPGSLETAHSDLEEVPVNEILAAVRVYGKIALEFCN